MRILVTGTEGYLGSLIAPALMERGHSVLGLDTGFYMSGWLYRGVDRRPETALRDLRTLEAEDLEGIDAVVHCAELSNDPLGALAPEVTFDINHRGSVHLATLAKRAGVTRFVYMSSCSVYGVAAEDIVDETSDLNPQTAYAECKRLVERDLGAMADDDFSPTFLRNATAYGASPRMRFDIVLNNLAGWAHTTGEIRLLSDGTPWRPLVHALDIVEAVCRAVEAPRGTVHNEVFNVGNSRHNYQIREIAEIVADTFQGCKLVVGEPGGDNRSYRVNFDKIATELPGFRAQWDAERGARQLRDVFERVELSHELFDSRHFTRLKALQHLRSTHQVDENFYWVATPREVEHRS
ncbi:MAG: SDR family oxidoreductase [Deinococcales bacterium]|jgi:nucleoside-diphosphate-sugar epimerase